MQFCFTYNLEKKKPKNKKTQLEGSLQFGI